MFPLHERTRRRICRAAFLALGLAPMLAALAFSAAMTGGAHEAAFCTAVGTELGLDVRVENLSHPRPGQTILYGLRLLDPDSGRQLGQARVVEIDANVMPARVRLSYPEVDISDARWLWKLVDDRLLRQRASPAITILSGSLALRGTGGARTLFQCRVDLTPADEATSIDAAFAADEAAEQPDAKCRIARTRRAGEALNTIEVSNGSAALPCWLLADLLGCENRMGRDSTFRGSWTSEVLPDGLHARMHGTFDNVDLHSVVSSQFPHRLGGQATIAIEDAAIRGGRLANARGALAAGPGIVSRSLLDAATRSLGMAGLDAPANGEFLNYQNLAATFTLDDAGLRLEGNCPNAPPGTLMEGQGGPLLSQTTREPKPAVALVQALVPDSRVQVPATRQTSWLVGVLPMPDVQPRDPNAAPQARLRGSPLR